MIRRGEIRWYQFKSPDRKRPVLILTRNTIIDYLGEVTIAPITTTIREIPSEVRLSHADGMPTACVVNFDHIQTIQKTKIGSLISTLSKERLAKVKYAISFALEL